ncbi:MAG: PAS domain S-box protein [Gemmatimonadaceae bacterium]
MGQTKTFDPQAHLAALIKSSEDAIASKDLNGIIMSWNPAAERMFGYTQEEAVGQSIYLIIPEDRKSEEEFVLGRVRSGEGVDHYETVRRRKDGSFLDVSLTVSPIRDSTGKIVGASKIARDITEKKRLAAAEHAQLIRERTFQAEANRIKDQFLATLSHELRTPLNAIIGWAEMLLGGNLNDQETELGLRTIDRNARAQIQLVDDLLDVSRIISGKMRLQIGQVDLVDVAKAAMDVVRPAALAKKIKLVGDFKRPDLFVQGDVDRLHQVAWNLLSNAIKFTPARGQVTVKVESSDEGGGRFIVEDSGAGIPDKFLPHVFERFRQEDGSLTRSHGGLGLGLAIVRHIVELHGGTVSAKSLGENKGSTFMVELPSASPKRPPGEVPSLRASGEARLDGVRVLLVDDRADDRQLLGLILSRQGAEVHTASSADEALEALQTWRPDVLVSDIAMPNHDGYSLMSRVRKSNNPEVAKIPSVAVTAHARQEDRKLATDAGFGFHVSKPIDRRRLIDAVASAAGRRERLDSPANGTAV